MFKNYFLILFVFYLINMTAFAGGEITLTNIHFDSSVTVCTDRCEFNSIKKALAEIENGAMEIIIKSPVLIEYDIKISGKVAIRSGLTRRVTIKGDENKQTAKERVFTIDKTGIVLLKDLVIENGFAKSFHRAGGGILNQGKLTVDNCDIANNSAYHGGGIWNSGELLLMNSNIIDNTTIRPTAMEIMKASGCRGAGGGLKNEKPGKIKISNSTISGNEAKTSGGGIFLSCETETTIINSKVNNNNAKETGGGIHNRGILTLNHVIVENNFSRMHGKGLQNFGVLNITDSKIAGNQGSKDCLLGKGKGFLGKGTIGGNSNNVFGSGNCGIK